MQSSRTTWYSSNEVKERREKKTTSRTGKENRRRGEGGEVVQRLWNMLCADNAGIVSRSLQGLKRMMTVFVSVWSTFKLTVSEAKKENMSLQTKGKGNVSFTIYAAGQVYKQVFEFKYLGGAFAADRDHSTERTRCLQRSSAFFQLYKKDINDCPGVRLRLKVRLLKAEMVEGLLYGCMTCSPNKPYHDSL